MTNTILDQINDFRRRIKALNETIEVLQNSCRHENVTTTRTIVGYNGYSHDIQSWCKCIDCDKGWFHDGYCGGNHKQP